MGYTLGNICHVEIPATDIAASMNFYGAVFSWSFHRLHDDYWFFDAGNIAGALTTGATPSHSGTVIVIKTDDLADRLAAIEAAGGTVLQGVTEAPGDHGFYGYFADPAGNKLGVWMPRPTTETDG